MKLINPEKKVLAYFSEYNIDKNRSFVIAFSGGPDSCALLSILKKMNIHNLYALYVNHGIRSADELENEEHAVVSFCTGLDIPLAIKRIPHGELEVLKKNSGDSMEHLARNYRYNFLNEFGSEINADYICLGHNLDDNVETAVCRFFQGSDEKGLKGIPRIRDKIIRPLIDCPKLDVLDYLHENNIVYSIDSTNQEDIYLRNRVRNELLPLVSSIFPGFKGSIQKLIEKMSNTSISDHFLLAEKLWEEENGVYFVTAENYLSCSFRQRQDLVLYAFNNFYKNGDKKRLPFHFLKPLADTVEKGNVKNILKGHGITMFLDGDRIFWYSDIVDLSKKRYLIVIKEIKFRDKEELYGEAEVVLPFPFSGTCEIVLFLDDFTFPVYIRNKIADDWIQDEDKRRSVRKILLSWRLTEQQKNLVPVVHDCRGNIAVLGSIFGKKAFISKHLTNTGNQQIKIIFRGRRNCAKQR